MFSEVGRGFWGFVYCGKIVFEIGVSMLGIRIWVSGFFGWE